MTLILGVPIVDDLAGWTPPAQATPAVGETELITTGSFSGGGLNAPAFSSVAGRYVAFGSKNGTARQEVYVKDTQTGAAARASVPQGVSQPTNVSGATPFGISADGRYVLFGSGGVYTPGAIPTTNPDNLYVRDRAVGTTTLVSTSTTGTPVLASKPVLSADGVTMAYHLATANPDVYAKNLVTGVVELVSVTTTGTSGGSATFGALDISSDGRFVVFESPSPDLVAGDTNGARDIFLRDRQLGTTERVSVSATGGQLTLGIGAAIPPRASVSDDGRFIGLWTSDTAASSEMGYVSCCVGTSGNVYLRDRQTNTTILANKALGGGVPNERADLGDISPDGRYVGFSSMASNLAAGDDGQFSVDHFLHDRLTRSTTMITGTGPGVPTQPCNGRESPRFSADGSFVTYNCGSSNPAEVYLHKFQVTVPVGGAVQPPEQYGAGACGTARTQAQVTNDPVNTASGNFWHTFGDFAIPGRGPALALSRTYNSLDATGDGWFGRGWSSSYETALSVSGATAVVKRSNGSRVTFTQSGTAWAAPPRAASTLVQNADGTWTFRCRATDTYTFDSAGRLTRIADRNGYATNITYPSASQAVVTDPSSRTLTFAFTGSHVTSVTDSASPPRATTYTYSGVGDLSDVVDVGGGHWKFGYDASHRMLTMRSPKYFGDTTTSPTPVVTNHYDAQGRVDWQSDELGRTTTFDYNTVPGSTIVTDPKGNKVRYAYLYGLLMEEERGYGSPSPVLWRYDYDPFSTARTRVVDPLGRSWVYAYDGNGNLLSARDPLNRTSSATYNALNQPLTVTDAKNVVTTLTYDAAGNPLTRSTPWLEGPPSTNQQVTYHYEDATRPGDVTSMTDPAGKVWTYTYDLAGDRVTSTDPLGNTTRSCFDTVGRRTAVTSPRGVAAGVTCSSPAPAPHTSYFTYNAHGDVLTETDPLGHVTTRTYDADRQVATLVDATNLTTTHTFDPAGQLTHVLRPNLTTLRTEFWADGTIKAQYDGAGRHTDYAYDTKARLITVTDPLGRVTTFGYDAAGNHTSKQDAGGNCASTPKTGCTTLTYDAANQMTGIDYSDAATPDVTNMTYDAVGHRTAMTDGTGTTTYTWDSLGRMTSSAAPGGTVGYSYDLRGLPTGLVYPNGMGTVTRVFDHAGRLQSMTDWLNNTTTFGYDADDNPVTQVNPNNTTESLGVDDADRVTSVRHAPTTAPAAPFASFTYGRDNEDKVTSVTSSGVPADDHTWGYSSLDQVTTDTASPFPYAYDSADNLTQLTDRSVQAFDAAAQLSYASAPISLVGTGGSANNNAATVVAGLPAGVQPNDQIVVSATQPANTDVTTPSGYVLVGSWKTGNNASNTKVSVFRKTAAGGEASVSVTFSATTVAKTVTAAVYRGVDTTTPVEVTSSATSSTSTVVMPSVSPSLAGSRLVAILGATQGATAGAVWSAPTGMVKQAEQSIVSTDAAIADQPLTASGATGTRTATLGTTGKLVGALLVLKPTVTGYGYDTRGNRTSRTAASTTTYGYDQANRMVSHASGGTTTSYTYNGDGLRTGRGGTSSSTFHWDTSGGVPRLLVDGTTAYVYGPDGHPLEQISGTTVLHYHHDQLGSTRALTNSAGAVVATYSYDAYGKETGSTGTIVNPLRYAGEYVDAESGFVYLRARYYDPATGQFLTRDPLAAVSREPYGYVYGDPLNATDPTGLWCPLGKNPNGSCRGTGVATSGPAQTVKDITDVASTVFAVGAAVSATTAVFVPPSAVVTVPLAGALEVGSTATGVVATAIECADGGRSFDCSAGVAASALPFVSAGVVRQVVRLWGPEVGKPVNAAFANLDAAVAGASEAGERMGDC